MALSVGEKQNNGEKMKTAYHEQGGRALVQANNRDGICRGWRGKWRQHGA